MNKFMMLATLLSTQVFAQVASEAPTEETEDKKPAITADLNISNQDRFFQIGDKLQVAQYNVTIKGSVDINGAVQIHGMVQTGNNYGVGFNHIYDIKNDEFVKNTNLYVKRLYLQKAFMDGKVTAQLGALGTRKSIAKVNKLSNIGWIDGGRVNLKTSLGDVTVTAGQLKSDVASVFERAKDLEFNYFEVTVSKAVLDNLLVEGGIEVYDDNTYIQAASQYDLEIATGKVLRIIGDAKVQTNTAGVKAGIGVANILSLLGKKAGKVKLDVNYEYVTDDFDNGMHIIANGMHEGYTGGAVVLESSFPIYQKIGLSGFTHVRVGNEKSDLRVETGVKQVIYNSKKHRQKQKIKELEKQRLAEEELAKQKELEIKE